MTNFLHMALVVLGVNTTDLTATNHVAQTCKEALCENATNNACIYLHYKPTEVLVATRKTYVIGVKDQPLFKLIEQRSTENNGRLGYVYYNEGVFWDTFDTNKPPARVK